MPYHEWTDRAALNDFCAANGLRNFATVEEMNSTITDRFNERIRESDVLFLLGDIGFGSKDSVWEFMRSLRCKNVHLIYGNHDKDIEKNRDGVQGLFKSCEYYRDIYVDGQHIVLSHYSITPCVWNKAHRGSIMLFGHSHGALVHDPKVLSMDVGVDTNDMRPYSFDDIKTIMEGKHA